MVLAPPARIEGLFDLIAHRFGFGTEPEGIAPTISVGTTVVVAAPAQPRRVVLILVNLGAASIFITPEGVPSSSNGILLAANGGNITLIWDEDFDLLAREWRAVAASGTNALFRLSRVLVPLPAR